MFLHEGAGQVLLDRPALPGSQLLEKSAGPKGALPSTLATSKVLEGGEFCVGNISCHLEVCVRSRNSSTSY